MLRWRVGQPPELQGRSSEEYLDPVSYPSAKVWVSTDLPCSRRAFWGKAGRGRSLSRKGLEQELGSEEGGPQYCAVRVSEVGAGLGEKRQQGPSFWFQAELKETEMCP